MLGPPQSEIGHNREKRKKKFAPILWVLLPVRLTLCDFEAPGGGALVSAQCCAVFFLADGVCVWWLLWLLPVLLCLVWRHSNPWWYQGWYNAITLLQVTDVANWPVDHSALFVLLCVFVCLFVCLFVCFAFAFVFGCFFVFLLLHPLKWPIVILRLVVLVDFYGPASTWHTSCHLHAPRWY